MFLPEAGELIAADGTAYAVSQTQRHRDWAQRHPDQAMSARFHVVWPRTTPKGLHLTLVKSKTPETAGPMASQAGAFTISGMVVNQRGRRNQTVLRVMRNAPAPKKQHRLAQYAPHLLFLTGRLSPASRFINSHATLRCRLAGQQLVIKGVTAVSAPQEERMEMAGLIWPWPALASRATLERLKELNLPEQKGNVLVAPGFRQRLDDALAQMTSISRVLIGQVEEDRRLSRNADRLRLIAKRIGAYLKRMDDIELAQILEETALLVVLKSLQDPQLTTVSKMPTATAEPKTEPKRRGRRPAPAPEVPADLQELARLLEAGCIDGLLRSLLSLTPAGLRSGINALVALGWYARLSEEQKGKLKSYQLKKLLQA